MAKKTEKDRLAALKKQEIVLIALEARLNGCAERLEHSQERLHEDRRKYSEERVAQCQREAKLKEDEKALKLGQSMIAHRRLELEADLEIKTELMGHGHFRGHPYSF